MGVSEKRDFIQSMIHACIAHSMKSMKHHYLVSLKIVYARMNDFIILIIL